MKSKVVNIGLIGLGGMANEHIRRISLTDSLHIAALCDINEEALKMVGDQTGVSEQNRFTDMEAMIASSDVDAVISVVPNHLHAKVLELCIYHQKAIMAEKPFTMDLDEANHVLALYEKNPIPCTISFIHRYTPSFQYAKKLLEENEIGPVRHIDVRYLQSFGAPIYDTPYIWRYDKEITGTGALGDLGAHMIDSARYFIGEFQSVSAIMKTIVKSRKDPVTGEDKPVHVDDFTSFQAELHHDVIGNFITTRNAIGSSNQHEVTLYGDYGTIRVNIERPREIDIFVKNDSEDNPGWKTEKVPEDIHLTLHQDFANLVINKHNQNCPSFYDGYQNQKILERIIQSAESGQTINID